MNKKEFIVCYSHSGNTWKVAEEIRKQTGALLCEIYPKQPYPMSFIALLDQVEKELEQEVSPKLFPLVEKVEEYPVVFVGTPNWCGKVAPPMRTFLQENNMDGKLLLPFYTHCGNGIEDDIAQDIKELCPGATVGEGLCVTPEEELDLAKTIANWIKKVRSTKDEKQENN